MKRKKAIVSSIIILALLVLLMVFVLLLPKYSQSSYGTFTIDTNKYSVVTDDATIEKIDSFNAFADTKNILVRDGVLVKVVTTALDKNVVLKSDLWDTEYYINSDFQFPDLTVENVEIITISNGEKTTVISGKTEITDFLAKSNQYPDDTVVYVKYKNYDFEEWYDKDKLQQSTKESYQKVQ